MRRRRRRKENRKKRKRLSRWRRTILCEHTPLFSLKNSLPFLPLSLFVPLPQFLFASLPACSIVAVFCLPSFPPAAAPLRKRVNPRCEVVVVVRLIAAELVAVMRTVCA